MVNKILQLAEEIEEDVIKNRRAIHRYPELALQEYKTSELIIKKLKKLGLEVEANVDKTGVVALLRGDIPGKTVALRADMDALPILEETDYEFKSVNKDIMHACGHDAHVAGLLGAAEILSHLTQYIKGNVKFIFQPSEESNLGGAKVMIEAGVLENPKVAAVIGLHVDPSFLAGEIGYREGAFFATGGGFEIKIKGRGGHGAEPHKSIDAILIAVEIIQAFQTISSSRLDPMEPFVLTVGTIAGGSKANIIADTVTFGGTFRCFKSEIASKALEQMERIVENITKAYFASYEFEHEIGGAPLYNDPYVTKIAKKSAVEIVSENNVRHVSKVLLGEDFAYYSHLVPSTFLMLGVGYKNKENYPLHHPKFHLDEKALRIGAALLANSAINFLSE